MEGPELTSPASPTRDQPAPAPGPPGTPVRQASPHLTVGPIILPPEQGLAPTVFLKALPIPLYHTVPPGGLQPRAPLVTGSLDGGSMPFILSTLLQPEGPGPTQVGKPATPTLTVNLVRAPPVLSPGLGPTPGSLAKVRSSGKYLCPHCSRDCLKPSVLEKHLRSHTGERPFPCATCGIAFKTQSNLYKHRRTQTHLSNSRLSSESEGAGSGPLEDGGQAGGPSRAAGKGDSRSPGGDNGARPERPLSPGIQGTHLSRTARGLEPKLEAVPSPGSTFADREAPLDPTHTASAGLPQAGSQPRHKRPEQTSPTASRICSVQQQPPTFSEKPRDTKAAEGRLRKCGSTDSGYLSRSDSAEQPPAPGSPLHSLSEHSAESEGEGAPGPGGTKAARGGRGPGLELGKRQLEERIARLISHNQAVVDDPQLDHVRPRKTVLSKQGSIDLPVPYTYKDSFHFEIRAPEPGRSRHGALGTARSTCTPLDKTRPLFFHSVPTQLSTGVECVPVTRSNSLPFVEGARTWQESPDPPDSCPRKQKPLSPRPPPTRLVGVPSGHPRALVRQAAVEDLPCPPTGETTAPVEDPDGKRAVAGDGAAGRGKAAGRKCSPRKPQMFSQEKWQVYGHETFQRIYQKMKTSHQGGRKAKEATVGRRTETDLSHQGEALQGECTAPSQDRGTPVSGGTSAGAKPGLWESLPATEGFLVTESPKQRETVARAGGSDQPRVSRAMSPSTLGLREPSCFGSKSPVLPPDGRTELACPLSPVSGPLEGGDLGAPRPLLPDPKLEGGTGDGGDAKEPCHSGLTVPRLPSDSSGEPQPAGAKLSSEWKKLRVEPSGTLGAGGQTPGGPVQATPPPAGSQDLDPGEEPGGLHSSADCLEKGRPRLLEVSGASFSDPLVALRPVGLRDKAPVLRPAAGAPGGHYQPAAQTRVPSTPVALTDTAFPPKYLLRVRQGETLPPPSGSQGPGGVQDPLRRSEYPVEPAPSVESGLGTPLPPCPAMGLAPGGTDNFGEDSSWPRPWGRGNGVLGEEKGGLDASIPATEESPSLSTGDPREMASNLSTVTCDSRKTETHHTGHLWVGSTWVRGWPTGGVLTPQALNRDVEGSPETIREDPPPGLLAGHSPCGSLRPSPVLSALPALGWPELASCARSESPGSCGPQGPFPSLRAEPRLTWCCLSRSLPLPMERKEKSASAGWVQPCLGDGSPDHGAGPRPESKAVAGQWTRTRPAEGGQTQPWKLPCPAAPGMTTQDPGSEPERKKGPPRRRAKVSRGSGKKTKLRRFRGNLLQSRVQLRAGRRRKSLWVLRKACDASPLEGLNPHGTVGQAPSGMAGLHLRQELPCATSALSLGHGNGDEEEEEDQSPVSGSIYPGARPGTVRERDALAVKGIMPSAGELGDCCPQNSAVPLESSLSPASCVQAANDSLLSCDQGLDLGLPENWLQPPQEQVPAGPQPRVFPDAEQHSSFESKGNSPRRDSATSVAVLCTSLGASGGHTPLGTPSVESPDHGQLAGKAPTQTSLAGKAAVQGTSPALLPGKPSPGQGLSGLASLGSPSSGPGSASLHQEEGRPKTGFPPQGQHGYGEGLATGPPSGAGSDKGQESGLLALEGRVFPSKPGQPTGVPEAPSKTTKRRSLEGMRKQARVEFSDTSSDDEDRLVIEI